MGQLGTSPASRSSDGVRALCLIALPTLGAFVPWLMLAASGDDGIVSRPTSIISACSPLAGLAIALSYRLLAPQSVRLWPFVPLAVVAVYFFVGCLVIDAVPDSNMGVAMSLALCLAVLPFVAFLGGVVGYIAVGSRRAGLAA